MTKILLFSILFSYAATAFGQRRSDELEITPYAQFDRYPKFSYVIGDRPNTDFVKLTGISWGINTAYKFEIKNRVYLKAGIGYFQYRFNDVSRVNTSFGSSDSRDIKFPSPLFIPFFTDKYWYNTLSVHAGLEKLIMLNKTTFLATAVQFVEHFTFSQHYHITYRGNSIDNDYTLRKKKNFAFSGNLQSALLKKIGRLSIGPMINIPVIQIWKEDEVFPEENNSNSRNKWFNAIGLGIQTSYSLSKK